jgi:hypothetical protein
MLFFALFRTVTGYILRLYQELMVSWIYDFLPLSQERLASHVSMKQSVEQDSARDVLVMVIL